MTSRQIKAAQLRHRMAVQAMTPHRLPKRPTEIEQRMAATIINSPLHLKALLRQLSIVAEPFEHTLANLSALSVHMRTTSHTMKELNDAMLTLRGLPCYYPPLQPRPRPKPRRTRAKHRPTRLQRRRGRQAKSKA